MLSKNAMYNIYDVFFYLFVKGICKVFAEVLEESGIFSTRLPLEFGIEEWAWIPNSRRDFYSSVVNDAKEAKIVFRNHGLRYCLK